MTVKVGINGFGRIGRLVARALYASGRTDLQLVAVNDLADTQANALLFKYDSVHGRFTGSVETAGNDLVINGQTVRCFQERDPANLRWGDAGVDIVLECSGIFTSRDKAGIHIEKGGAKKVLISAPATDDDITVVYGVNHDKLTPEHKIVSNASCTTNCLTPVVHVLHGLLGIQHGYMTTIHSYTGDQRIVDSVHKDLHRARAAAINMIPTTTGAARSVARVIPELKGKLDGMAMRVPTPNVSVVDFKFVAGRKTTAEEVNAAIKEAAEGHLKGILGWYDEPLVSSDFNGDTRSSIFAVEETKVIEDTFVRIMTWYDNEWGFSNRMLDTATVMGKVG